MIDELYWLYREASSLVPYKLNDAKLAARGQMSNELLTILRSAEHQAWQYFVILDESWFYLSTDYEIIELPDGESFPEMEKHMIQARKMMVIIAWIYFDFTLSKSFQKENHLMQPTLSNIF
jgi:hypothetical protein